MMQRRDLALAALPLLAGPAMAQAPWPSRTIRLVVPWPPGQATDLVGRTMAQVLTERLGQQVVPENKAGAGGSIGTDTVAKAAPDGYTLLAASIGPISLGPLINRTPYDVERDFAPIATFSGSPYVLITRSEFAAQTARDFVALIRANPGRFTYASSGVGGAQHVLAALFAAQAGYEALHIPFQGSGPALAALLGGQVDFAVETLAACGALLREGRLRGLGVTTARGTTLAPEIPPLGASAGVANYDYTGWIGMMAPAATPAPILERLARELEAASAQPEMRARLALIGVEPSPRGPAAFRTMLAEQRAVFEPVLRQLGIRAE